MTNNKLIIFTDGGARGNPGPAAIGVYITDDTGKEIIRFGKKIGNTTNNVAEYRAVIFALDWLILNHENENEKEINFFLDSKLVVNQLKGIFKIKEAHLKELVIEIKGKEKEINKPINYLLIPREKNFVADQQVNLSLDL